MDDPFLKKRNRVPASCSVCRRRKSKCDRIRPICGSCKRKSIAHLCYYESTSPKIIHDTNDKSMMRIPTPGMYQNRPPQYHPPPPLLMGLPQPYSPAMPIPPGNIQDNKYFANPIQAGATPVVPVPLPPPPAAAPAAVPAPPPVVVPPHTAPSHTAPPNIPALVMHDLPPPNNASPTDIPTVASTASATAISKSHSLSSHVSSSASPPIPTPSSTASYPEQRIAPMQSQEITPSNSMNGVIGESFSSYTLVSIPLGPNSSLQVSPEDRMNVFTNASFSMNVEGSIWQQHGTLSYIGLTKSDPFIKVFRNFAVLLLKAGDMATFFMSQRKRRRRRRSTTSSNGGGSGSSEKSTPSDKRTHKSPEEQAEEKQELEDRANLEAEDLLILTKFVRQEDKQQQEEEEAEIKADTLPKKIFPGVESLYSNEKTSKQDYYALVEKIILDILPTKLNLFMLVTRFFKYVYPFIPIIDEQVLVLDVHRSLLADFPQFNQESYQELTINNDDDLRTMGILLVVMRLGYMSMNHNEPRYNNYTPEENLIIKQMQLKLDSKTFSHIINLCISDGLIASRSSFKLVQLLTLVYFYRQVSPDDSQGISGADSHILFGVIMKHAMTIGLNRDPSSYSTHEPICNNASLCKTWRFLWHYLVKVDAVSAIHSGTNLNLMNIEISDVQLPRHDISELNYMISMEDAICRSYRIIVNKISNVSQKPKIVDILSETNHLEKLFYEYFGKDFFNDVVSKPAIINDNDTGLVKVMKYCMFIQLRTNLSGMYYMIAIHYENVYNESKTPSMNAGIELFKIYIKSVVQLVYIMSYVLDNSVELFGKNYDYYLTCQNERYMIKTHSFLTSFFVRLLHQKQQLTHNKPRLEVIDNLFTMVLLEAELFVGNFRKLSKTYINSYRLYIITYIILRQCGEDPNVFTFENDQGGTNMIEFFTIGELNRLCALCGEFKMAKEQQRRKLQLQVQPERMGEISFDESFFEELENKNDLFDPDNDEILKLFDLYGDLAQ
ncbi:Multidrug resistance regulator 1 [Spathaspora sp. JA1]|nr:Multidrug resistance regulator 1 [Spathaspora sp. JA1]